MHCQKEDKRRTKSKNQRIQVLQSQEFGVAQQVTRAHIRTYVQLTSVTRATSRSCGRRCPCHCRMIPYRDIVPHFMPLTTVQLHKLS
jgi:hypothetical protein